MHQHLFDRAREQLQRGQVEAAIETLAALLGEDPDDAAGHALLALCLVRRKRLHAARLEAERALTLEPEAVLPHLAVAAVASCDRRFAVAEQHLQMAQALDPHAAEVQIQLARLYGYWDRSTLAVEHAERAQQLRPDDPDTLALIGELAFQRGERALAFEQAQAALEIDAEHVDALVLLGQCELAAGNAEAAREHAVWALQLDPEDAGALALLCAVKARQSMLLGLWWRFQSFISAGSGTRTILLLLGVFLSYRVISILLEHHGYAGAAQVLSYAWLGFCLYTWTAPALFLKALREEMQQVKLRPDF